MLKIFLVGCLALIALGFSFAGAKSTLIDQNGSDIESIAQVICEVKRGTSKQIGHSSSVNELVSFFNNLPPDHKLSGCGTKYAKSIEILAHILASNNDNVCDESKLADIEEFHRNYVSRLPKHVESRKSRQLNIPKIIKLFFLHYATEVSSICARDALKQMETLKINSGHAGFANKINKPEIDSSLAYFEDILGTSNLEQGYCEVFLPWLLADGLPLERYSKAASYIAQTGDKKLFVKIKDAERLINLQLLCSTLMRPMYKRILLPVIRLISLGYYPSSQELAQQLAQESQLKRLYVVTQLCETVLPIQVIPDQASDAITLVHPDDAPKTVPSSPKSDALVPLTSDDLGFSSPENQLIDFKLDENRVSREASEIKANVAGRSKGLGRILRLMTKATTGHLESKIKKILMKRGNKQEELEPTVDETKIEETSSKLASEYQQLEQEDEDEDEEDGDQVGHLARRKRWNFNKSMEWAKKFFKEVALLCAIFVPMVVVIVGTFIKFLGVIPLNVIYQTFREISGVAIGDIETALEWAWNVGGAPADLTEDLTAYHTEKEIRRIRYIGPRKRDQWKKLNEKQNSGWNSKLFLDTLTTCTSRYK